MLLIESFNILLTLGVIVIILFDFFVLVVFPKIVLSFSSLVNVVLTYKLFSLKSISDTYLLLFSLLQTVLIP